MYNVLQYCYDQLIHVFLQIIIVLLMCLCVLHYMSDQTKLSKANQSKNQEWTSITQDLLLRQMSLVWRLIFGWIIKRHFHITVSNSSLRLLL